MVYGHMLYVFHVFLYHTGRIIMRNDCVHTYPGYTHANLSWLIANLSWLVRKPPGKPGWPKSPKFVRDILERPWL